MSSAAAIERKIYTLLDISRAVKRALETAAKGQYWIKAEIVKLNYYSHSGHCYPDLVEKKDGKVVAQFRSTLFAATYKRLSKNFMNVTGEELRGGMEILFCAKVKFDAVYGLSLDITDIDPSFTLGSLEKEKQQTIARLREEGIYDNNRNLPRPILPNRLAVISVQTSNGYADFNNAIKNAGLGNHVFHLLFPSILQGESAVTGIASQLQKIRNVANHFDAVAIIRGGGGDVGLSCYNDYRLASLVAAFPIPVFTGVGHATNQTVVEMVSNYSAITPTDLANFIVKNVNGYVGEIEQLANRLRELQNEQVSMMKERIKHAARTLKTRFSGFVNFQHQTLSTTLLADRIKNILSRGNSAIDSYKIMFSDRSVNSLKQAAALLNSSEGQIHLLDPANILKRGYSITFFNGKPISDPTTLAVNGTIETLLSKGKITSTVTTINMDHNE